MDTPQRPQQPHDVTVTAHWFNVQTHWKDEIKPQERDNRKIFFTRQMT